jgi:hypothetical protein
MPPNRRTIFCSQVEFLAQPLRERPLRLRCYGRAAGVSGILNSPTAWVLAGSEILPRSQNSFQRGERKPPAMRDFRRWGGSCTRSPDVGLAPRTTYNNTQQVTTGQLPSAAAISSSSPPPSGQGLSIRGERP